MASITPIRAGIGPAMATPSPDSRRVNSSRPQGSRSTSPGGRRFSYRNSAALLRRNASQLNVLQGGGDSCSSLPDASLDGSGTVEAYVPIPQYSTLQGLQEKVIDVQRKRETDRRLSDRHFQQLEQKVDALLEDRSKEQDVRKKWAEVTGFVTGLQEEVHGLSRRFEDMDQKMISRTSGLESLKQRSHDLDKQVTSVHRQVSQSSAAHEEVQKRMSSKLHRTEKSLEELSRRLSKMEDVLQAQPRERSSSSRALAQHAKELDEFRQHLGSLSGQHQDAQSSCYELRQRVAWLEETQASAAVPKPLVVSNQDSIVELTEQLSCLHQRSSCTDQALASLQGQVQQLHAEEHNREHCSAQVSRSVSKLQAEVGAMSEQVRDLHARLLEAESNFERPSGLDVSQDGDSSREHQNRIGSHGPWQSQLEAVMREVQEFRKVKQWLVALEQQGSLPQLALQAGETSPSSENEDPLSLDAQPPFMQHWQVEELHQRIEEISQHVTYSEDSALRLEKLEERTDLYWTYTKSVASNHEEQMEKLIIRLQDMENSHGVLQEVLHDVEVAAPSGPRTLTEQLRDFREEVVALKARGTATLEQPNGELSRSSRRQHEMTCGADIVERLSIVEGRVSQSDKIMQQLSDKLLRKVSEDLSDHRQDVQAELVSTQASINSLSDKVYYLEGFTSQPRALGDLIAKFNASINAHDEVMTEEDLETLEAALQEMQGSCLKAANDIAQAVQTQLHSLPCAWEASALESA